jgi:hypothetical protein
VRITEEKEEREGKMSRFKVGDIVRIAESSCFHGTNYYNPADEDGIVIDSKYAMGYKYKVDWGGRTNRYRGADLYLVENNKEQEMPDTEKKYKITTELSLQEVTDLKRALLHASGFGKLHEELSIIYREAQRKVVKVGDKEYYEDELATALASINPIGE